MAEHQEGFAEDVGGKLLLFAALIAIFGAIALVLMPLGAAFAPPATVPVTTEAAAPATAEAAATAQAPTDSAGMSSEAATPAAPATNAAPPAAAPKGPPPFIAAFFPGIIMLVVAAILGVFAGLLLGYAKARSEDAAATAATPH